MSERAIGLERASIVLDRHAGDLGNQPVCDHRRNLAGDQPVLAIESPANDDVVALVDLREEVHDVLRIILQIAVHGDEHLAAGLLDARCHRGCLPVVPPEIHDAYPRVCTRNLDGAVQRAVVAAIVDQHDLEGDCQRLDGSNDRRMHAADVLFLVIERNDD